MGQCTHFAAMLLTLAVTRLASAQTVITTCGKNFSAKSGGVALYAPRQYMHVYKASGPHIKISATLSFVINAVTPGLYSSSFNMGSYITVDSCGEAIPGAFEIVSTPPVITTQGKDFSAKTGAVTLDAPGQFMGSVAGGDTISFVINAVTPGLYSSSFNMASCVTQGIGSAFQIDGTDVSSMPRYGGNDGKKGGCSVFNDVAGEDVTLVVGANTLKILFLEAGLSLKYFVLTKSESKSITTTDIPPTGKTITNQNYYCSGFTDVAGADVTLFAGANTLKILFHKTGPMLKYFVLTPKSITTVMTTQEKDDAEKTCGAGASPLCDVADGSAVSSKYPCQCGSAECSPDRKCIAATSTCSKFCHEYLWSNCPREPECKLDGSLSKSCVDGRKVDCDTLAFTGKYRNDMGMCLREGGSSEGLTKGIFQKLYAIPAAIFVLTLCYVIQRFGCPGSPACQDLQDAAKNELKGEYTEREARRFKKTMCCAFTAVMPTLAVMSVFAIMVFAVANPLIKETPIKCEDCYEVMKCGCGDWATNSSTNGEPLPTSRTWPEKCKSWASSDFPKSTTCPVVNTAWRKDYISSQIYSDWESTWELYALPGIFKFLALFFCFTPLAGVTNLYLNKVEKKPDPWGAMIATVKPNPKVCFCCPFSCITGPLDGITSFILSKGCFCGFAKCLGDRGPGCLQFLRLCMLLFYPIQMMFFTDFMYHELISTNMGVAAPIVGSVNNCALDGTVTLIASRGTQSRALSDMGCTHDPLWWIPVFDFLFYLALPTFDFACVLPAVCCPITFNKAVLALFFRIVYFRSRRVLIAKAHEPTVQCLVDDWSYTQEGAEEEWQQLVKPMLEAIDPWDLSSLCGDIRAVVRVTMIRKFKKAGVAKLRDFGKTQKQAEYQWARLEELATIEGQVDLAKQVGSMIKDLKDGEDTGPALSGLITRYIPVVDNGLVGQPIEATE